MVGNSVGGVDLRNDSIGRKAAGTPLAVLTAGAVVVAFGLGMYSVLNGERNSSQKMMRARVVGQGATVGLLVGYAAYSAYSLSDKETD